MHDYNGQISTGPRIKPGTCSVMHNGLWPLPHPHHPKNNNTTRWWGGKEKSAFWWKQQHSKQHCTQVEESTHTGKKTMGWKGKKLPSGGSSSTRNSTTHRWGRTHTHTHTGKKMMGWKWEEKNPPFRSKWDDCKMERIRSNRPHHQNICYKTFITPCCDATLPRAYTVRRASWSSFLRCPSPSTGRYQSDTPWPSEWTAASTPLRLQQVQQLLQQASSTFSTNQRGCCHLQTPWPLMLKHTQENCHQYLPIPLAVVHKGTICFTQQNWPFKGDPRQISITGPIENAIRTTTNNFKNDSQQFFG